MPKKQKTNIGRRCWFIVGEGVCFGKIIKFGDTIGYLVKSKDVPSADKNSVFSPHRVFFTKKEAVIYLLDEQERLAINAVHLYNQAVKKYGGLKLALCKEVIPQEQGSM